MQYQAAIALLAAASMANALSAAQTAELNAILADVQNHLSDYMGLATSGQISLDSLPAGVLNLGMAIAQGKETSALYDSVDMAAVETWLPALPWYSSRLSSEIDAALYTITHTTSTPAAVETSAKTSAPAAETSAKTSAAASSSPAAASSAPVSSAPVSSAAVSSAASTNGTVSAVSTSAPAGNTTVTATSTRMHTSTICIENCEVTSSSIAASAFQNTTTTVTECDEACHAAKSGATTTISSLTTVTSTHCDEVCHSSKSAAAGKTTSAQAGSEGKTTVTQVATISSASSAQGVHVQTQNGAAKKVAGLSAAVLGAVALLL